MSDRYAFRMNKLLDVVPVRRKGIYTITGMAGVSDNYHRAIEHTCQATTQGPCPSAFTYITLLYLQAILEGLQIIPIL